ncbi:SpoIID/LytB domain-containing protein, partial [Candidatus Peregrinibacteria bacterium]|nr:SpoIID/LytB domain-containing protein [Candidatus Peregrinibacteria bacterium]
TVTAPEKQGTFRIVLKPGVAGESLFLEPITLFIRVGQAQQGLNVTVPIIPFTKTTQAGTNDLIRIGLSFQGDPMITATGKYKLIAGGKEKATFNAGDLTQVVKEGRSFKVAGSGMSFLLSEPPKFVPEGNSYLMISNYENRPSWKPELNDNIYKGTLEVHEYNDDLVVVNELPLEDYLYGLAEIAATDPNEKIKAVIVLARSYALYYMTQDEKFPGAPFHLSDDPERSQKYLGYGFEKRNPTGVKAVKDTEGMVVTYNDKVIKTPYHSTNAGATKSALEVWGWTHTPYLVGVKDPGCEGLTPAGHGVGLSGCGSKYWAEQGKSYQDIIKYYFKGVEVEKR